MKIQSYNRNISRVQINPLRATANTSQEQQQAQLGQSLVNAGQAVARSGDVFEQIQIKRNQYELNENLQARTAQFDELMNLMDRDESILDFDKAFEEKSKEIYQEGKKQLSLPGMQRDYDQAFEQAKQSYTRQVASLSTRRTMSDGAARGTRLIENVIKEVGITAESLNMKRSEVATFLSESPFYSPEEKQQIFDDFVLKATRVAIEGGITKVYNEAEGDYIDKMEAAHQALATQDIKELSAEEYKSMSDMIYNMGEDFHRMEIMKGERLDNELTEIYSNLYVNAMETGQIRQALDWVISVNPFDDRLKKTWYDSFIRLIDDPDGPDKTVPPEFLANLIKVATDMSKDESYKDRWVTEQAVRAGLNSYQLEAAMADMNKFQTDYQNPIFKESFERLETLLPKFKEGEPTDEKAMQRYYEAVNQFREYILNGEYTPEQLPQLVTNLLADNLKKELAIELRSKDGINGYSDLTPENMGGVKDLRKFMQMMEGGELIGVRDFYLPDLKGFEDAYDGMMNSIIDREALVGLEKAGTGYLDDGKAAYTALIEGVRVNVQLMSDGTIQYWEHLQGADHGNWVPLGDFDFYSEEEEQADEEQDKVDDIIDTALAPENSDIPEDPLAKSLDLFENPFNAFEYEDPKMDQIRKWLAEQSDQGIAVWRTDLTRDQKVFLRDEYELNNVFEVNKLIKEVRNGAK